MATQLVSGSADAVLSALSHFKVINGNMELESDWVNYGTPTTNERSNEQAHGGTYSRKFVADGSTGGIRQIISGLTVGKTYLVEAWFYISAISSGVPRIHFDGVNIDLSGIPLASWNKTSLVRTYTGTSNDFRFHTLTPSISTVYVDDVSIKELTFLTLGKTELVSGIAQVGSSVSATLTLTMGTEEYVSGSADAVLNSNVQLTREMDISGLAKCSLHARNHISISGEELTHGIVKGY